MNEKQIERPNSPVFGPDYRTLPHVLALSFTTIAKNINGKEQDIRVGNILRTLPAYIEKEILVTQHELIGKLFAHNSINSSNLTQKVFSHVFIAFNPFVIE